MEPNIRRRKAVEKIKEYAGDSTIHGLAAISGSRGFVRIFWIGILISATIFCLYQFVCLIIRFRQFETSTFIKLEYGPLAFPSVTLCNLNPYKRSSLLKVPRLMELMSAYEDRLKEIT